MNKKLFAVLTSVVVFMIIAAPAVTTYAVLSTGVDAPTKLQNPLNVDGDIFALIKAIFEKIVLPIGGIIVVLAIIWSGFLFVKARGNPDELQTAKKNFLYTIIGAAILLGAWAIAMGVKATIESLTK